MRVLVISDCGAYGGVPTFLDRLLTIHKDHSVTTAVLIPRDAPKAHIETCARAGAVEILHGSKTSHGSVPPLLTPFHDLLFSWGAVWSWKPDLVVVSTGDPGRMSIALFFPIPVLYVLHSYPEHRLRLLPRWYLAVGACLNNAVMTVSHGAAKIISRTMGIPAGKIDVVYNSCKIPAMGAARRRPVVLTVGHLVPYKNPDIWLAVAERVLRSNPDVRFIWIGDGESLDRMRHEVQRKGLSAAVELPGYQEDPSPFYENAVIYFQPSIMESHGIAVVEAMSWGLPCVVSDVGGLPESVDDNVTGFVNAAHDVDGFTAKIRLLLDDPLLGEKMGRAGRLRASELFAEEVQEKKILALYKRLVKGKFT